MNDDQWQLYEQSLAEFCLKSYQDDSSTEDIISCFVGSDLLWCGPCALKDLTRKIVDASDSLRILQHDQKEKEKELEIEKKLSASLQKKLKENSKELSEKNWELQERVTQLENSIKIYSTIQSPITHRNLIESYSLSNQENVFF